MNLKEHIRVIRDVPEEGFVVYDTSTLLLDPLAWRHAIDGLAKVVTQYELDILAGIESRGFLLAAPLAYKLGLGFVTVHRPGRLVRRLEPHKRRHEHATDTFEVEADAVKAGQRVIVLDDVVATGKTMSRAVRALRQYGAQVLAGVCLVELAFNNGRARLDIPLASLVIYDDDDLIRDVLGHPSDT